MSNVIDGKFDQTAGLDELDWDEDITIKRGELIELCGVLHALMGEYMEKYKGSEVYEEMMGRLKSAEKCYLPEGTEIIESTRPEYEN